MGAVTAHPTALRDSAVRDSARVAVFAALIVALTLVPGLYLLGGAVPVTLQTLGITLAAAVLGPWRGAAAVLVYLGLIAVGLPVASGFRGGLALFAGPTGGFLVGFVPMAVVIGFLARAVLRRVRGARMPLALFGAAVAGLPVLYLVGVPWLARVTGMSAGDALLHGMWVFLPGDLVKAAVAAAVTATVARALPGIIGPHR
jgi:biotin transport system substrate-specific component